MRRSADPSRLVLGAAQLGQQYGNGVDRMPPDPAAAAQILHTAIRSGVQEIDTARAYGDSEVAIGKALAAQPAADSTAVQLVTKVRPLDDVIGTTARRVEVSDAIGASIRDSLSALRVDRLHTLLLHRARDLFAGGSAAIDRLGEAVADGSVGRWGVSVGTPEDLVAACDVADVGYLQLPFNLLDRRWSAAPVQQALVRRPDIRIVARSVLLQGLLSSNDPARWPPIPELDVPGIQRALTELVRTLHRRDALDLAIGYALGHPWIHAIVLGVRRPDQLPHLVESAATVPLTAEEIERVDALIPPGPPDLIDPSRWAAHRPHR